MDLKSYMSNYQGPGRIKRLLLIAASCQALELDAYLSALAEVKNTLNADLYKEVLSQASLSSHAQLKEEVFDVEWSTLAKQQHESTVRKLEGELLRAQEAGEKRIVRNTLTGLGGHYFERTQYKWALKYFERSFEFCTSQEEIVDSCINVVKVLTVMGNFSQISEWVSKAGDLSRYDAVTSGKLKCCLGIQHMLNHEYLKAATEFVSVSGNVGSQFNEVLSELDLGLYSGLTILASFSHDGIKGSLLNQKVSLSISAHPKLFSIIEQLSNGNFTHLITYLQLLPEEIAFDMYLSDQFEFLRNEIMRNALLHYFSSVHQYDIQTTALAFNTTSAVIDPDFRYFVDARLVSINSTMDELPQKNGATNNDFTVLNMNIGGGSHNIEGRNKPTSNTGLVYDIRMLSHRNIQDPPDRPDLAHPERPARISAAFGYLFEKGIGQECVRIEIPATGATDDILKLAHTEEHVNFLKQYEDCDDSELLEKASDLHQDIFFSHDSILAARVSCGGVLELCKAVWKGDVQNGVALVRPPGHHAEHDKAYGFCFFNNVAVAARYLQKFHQVKRILIVDWDVHHGNGIQKEFYNDPNVLYISLHRYKDFFPNDPVAYMDHVGGAEAEGRNVNIPWPCGGLRDADYLHAFHRIVMPVATEFQPDFVIVASGFDAAEGDPLGGCHISPGGYAHMAYMLKSLAKGKLVLALEGGYSIHAVKTSIYEVTRILLGHPPPLLPYRASHEDSESSSDHTYNSESDRSDSDSKSGDEPNTTGDVVSNSPNINDTPMVNGTDQAQSSSNIQNTIFDDASSDEGSYAPSRSPKQSSSSSDNTSTASSSQSSSAVDMVPQPVAIKTINQVIEYHSNYWKCLSTPYFHKPMSVKDAERTICISDLLDFYYSRRLKTMGLTEIMLQSHIQQLFGGRISSNHATISESKTICIYVHNSWNEVRGRLSEEQNTLSPESTFLVDGVTSYLYKMTQNNNVVIDIDVDLLSTKKKIQSFSKREKSSRLMYISIQLLVRVLKTLWDKIVCNADAKVVFLGSGIGAYCLMKFLISGNRSEGIMSRVNRGILVFPSISDLKVHRSMDGWFVNHIRSYIPSKLPINTRLGESSFSGGSGTSISSMMITLEDSILDYLFEETHNV